MEQTKQRRKIERYRKGFSSYPKAYQVLKPWRDNGDWEGNGRKYTLKGLVSLVAQCSDRFDFEIPEDVAEEIKSYKR